MLALMSATSSTFFEDECSRFTGSTITLDPRPLASLNIDEIATKDAPTKVPIGKDFKKLQRVRIEGSSRSSFDDILTLANSFRCLRELSLSYSLLSDELLFALSSEEHVSLETVRLEAHPDTKPLPRISDEAWFALESHSPNLNVVLTSYLSEKDDYDPLLATHVPVTHLYFGGEAPATVVRRIGENCPRLVELVVGAYGPGVIDAHLISTANGCPRLSTVGLGDCEITCSSLIKFVSICRARLQVLYVWETSLIEDSESCVTEIAAKVSRLLGRTWAPEYVPPW